MPRCRQAIERGIDEPKEPAKQPLLCKQFGGKIADMAGFNLAGIERSRREPRMNAFAKCFGNIGALSAPDCREIALPSAQDIRQSPAPRCFASTLRGSLKFANPDLLHMPMSTFGL